MRLQDYDVSTRYLAKVLSNERITAATSKEEVRDISLEFERDLEAKIGQNIGVLAPGQQELGQEHHFRLYSIADIPRKTARGGQQLSICVRRCTYVDQFSGERYPGIASNYLCDLRPGDVLTVTGPYGQAFETPRDREATLILIGAGTGIAPFRAFVKHIYEHEPDFRGRVWLFHGAQTGLDLLYRNDEKNDFALYYDRESFQAFDALSRRPGWSEAIDWGSSLQARGEELCQLLANPHTYVYLAGLEKVMQQLDHVLSEVAGSKEKWQQWKTRLQADNHWIELFY